MDETTKAQRELLALKAELQAERARQAAEMVERKRAEEALRHRELQTNSIIENAYDAFVGMDERGVITAWNAQAETIFGWSREEALGRTVAETIIPPQHREQHRRGLQHFL